MWAKKVTLKTTASRENIWNLWTDVQNWSRWDDELECSELNGKFTEGEKGILKAKKGPKSKFELILVSELNEFTSRSFLPLAKMDFTHRMSEKNGELFITHGIEIKGVLSFLFSKVIGEKLIRELPKAMNKLLNTAENK